MGIVYVLVAGGLWQSILCALMSSFDVLGIPTTPIRPWPFAGSDKKMESIPLHV